MTTLANKLSSHPSEVRGIPQSVRGILYNQVYYQGFVVALLLCWSPFKSLAYFAPFIMLGWFLVATQSGTVLRNVTIVLSLWLLWAILHSPFVGNFAWSSAFISILTYSSFLPIATIPVSFLAKRPLLPRMQRWMLILIIVQSVLGIIQALYGFSQEGTFDIETGDHVEGTIHPWLPPDYAFGNPMFAVNMTFLLLALLPGILTRRKHVLIFLLGSVVLILASVVHVLLFLGVAVGVVLLIYAPSFFGRRSGWLVIIMLTIAGLAAVNILSTNFGNIGSFFSMTVDAVTPRGILMQVMITDIPSEYPYMVLFGLGQGQFISRAGLIGTGYYFGTFENPRSFPFLGEQLSVPFETYMLPLWREMEGNIWWGSTHRPFSSWLSVYSEFGIFICVGIVLGVTLLLLYIRLKARTYEQKTVAISLSVGILFLLLLGWQENYWEVPQAIFPGLLILRAMYTDFVAQRPPMFAQHNISQHNSV
jgi:hypothetical protein